MATTHRAMLVAAMVLPVLSPVPGAAAEGRTISGHVISESPDGLFVDAGSEAGIEAGASGEVVRGGGAIARIEVVRAAPRSSLVRVLSSTAPGLAPTISDEVRIEVSAAATGSGRGGPAGGEAAVEAARPLGTLRGDGTPEEDFVPLLAPWGPQRVATSEPANMFHGIIQLRQLLQLDGATLQDYSVTRLGTSGTLERIGAGPWTLEWSGDLWYRAGEALEGSTDFEEPRLLVHRLSLFRRFDGGGTARVGRFIPRELPSVGYLDGVQGELPIGDVLRLGAVAGLKPDRDDLGLSADEPTLVPYVTASGGDRDGLHASGTAGILGSLYEGDLDRLAVVWDQDVSVGSRFSLRSTLEVDFDTGSAETRSGTRLTHLDLYGSYRFSPLVTVRAGLDHWERPDTRAERDLLEVPSPIFFEPGYWRYWAGATHQLPWDLLLSEEVSFIDPREADADGEVHWMVTLTRMGLPGLQRASLGLSIFNLVGPQTDGFGARVSTYLPLVGDRLSLDASLGMRLLDTDLEPDAFQLVDVAARLDWIVVGGWSVQAGVSYAFGTEVDAFLVELGSMFRW